MINKWDIIPLTAFLQTTYGFGRREEIEEHVYCLICGNHLVRPDNGGQERFLKEKGARQFTAVCSEECFNIFVLSNI